MYRQGGRGNAASSTFSHVLGRRGLTLGLGMWAPFSNWAFFFSFSPQTTWRGFLVVTKEGGKAACVLKRAASRLRQRAFQTTPRSSAGSLGSNVWLGEQTSRLQAREKGQEGNSRKSQDGGSRKSSFSPLVICCKLQTNPGLIYIPPPRARPRRALCLLRDKDGRR